MNNGGLEWGLRGGQHLNQPLARACPEQVLPSRDGECGFRRSTLLSGPRGTSGPDGFPGCTTVPRRDVAGDGGAPHQNGSPQQHRELTWGQSQEVQKSTNKHSKQRTEYSRINCDHITNSGLLYRVF